MQSADNAHRVGSVADQGDDQEARGAAVKRRRERLGLTVAAFAKKAHIDRGTLDRIEEGHSGVRGTTLAAAERALDDLEQEMGIDPEAAHASNVVRFVVKGVYGAESLVVEGPVENIAELERSVDRIMRRLAGPAEEE